MSVGLLAVERQVFFLYFSDVMVLIKSIKCGSVDFSSIRCSLLLLLESLAVLGCFYTGVRDMSGSWGLDFVWVC